MMGFFQSKCEDVVYLIGRKRWCGLVWPLNWFRIISEEEFIHFCNLGEVTQKFQV